MAGTWLANRSLVIDLVCDAGPRFGYGHLRRSAALAEALRALGLDTRLSPRSVRARSTRSNLPGRSSPPSAVLFDLPESVDPAIAATKRCGLPCVALDYFGHARPTLTISVLERAPIAPGRREHGFQFAIVRPEIRRLVLPASEQPDDGGILVILGGADVGNRSASVAHALSRFGHDVTVVIGPYAASPPPHIRCLRDPSDLPERMAGCRWAVSSGGVTLSELLCLGKPTFVVPQTPAERTIAAVLHARGAILGWGDAPTRAPSAIEAQAVGATARAVIDGAGADRIAARVAEVIR
jgi:spore coat polysaccharide biosynthesis predicted glycosyltransferase SpsG